MNMLLRTITLLFWLLCLAAYFMGWEGQMSFLPLIGLVVLAAHVLEVVLFFVLFKQDSQNPMKDALYVLVFGIFHLQPFINKKAQRDNTE